MSKKYLIKIDRRTVKRNPNAGATSSNYPGIPSVEISFSVIMCTGVRMALTGKDTRHLVLCPDGEIIRLTFNSSKVIDKRCRLYKLITKFLPVDNNQELLEEILDNDNKEKYQLVMSSTDEVWKMPEIDMDYNTNIVNHLPLPKWLYEYGDEKVKCVECGEVFSYTVLESDDYDGAFISNICPYCGEPDCCDIEYEKIEEVE